MAGLPTICGAVASNSLLYMNNVAHNTHFLIKPLIPLLATYLERKLEKYKYVVNLFQSSCIFAFNIFTFVIHMHSPQLVKTCIGNKKLEKKYLVVQALLYWSTAPRDLGSCVPIATL